MSWQEPIVAIIVGLAVVSLYRHLRDLMGSAAPDAQASCHGCDDCATDTDAAPPHEPETDPLLPHNTQIH
jgi:hypothetical protein